MTDGGLKLLDEYPRCASYQCDRRRKGSERERERESVCEREDNGWSVTERPVETCGLHSRFVP